MTTVATRLDEFRVAMMLLSRLPMGQVRGPVPDLAASAWAYPFAGLPLGLLFWAVHAGALGLGASDGLSGLLSIGVLVLLTGGLHFDGLADFADGIGGGRDRAHRLEIMRDSRIGSYGVLALVLGLGLWIVALGDLGADVTLWQVLCVAAGSRMAMLVLLWRLPPARADGLGAKAGLQDAKAVLPGMVLCAVLLLGLGLAGLMLLMVMAAVAALIGWRAMARVGGQTGDVLGATQVATEVAGWVLLSILLT